MVGLELLREFVMWYGMWSTFIERNIRIIHSVTITTTIRISFRPISEPHLIHMVLQSQLNYVSSDLEWHHFYDTEICLE